MVACNGIVDSLSKPKKQSDTGSFTYVRLVLWM